MEATDFTWPGQLLLGTGQTAAIHIPESITGCIVRPTSVPRKPLKTVDKAVQGTVQEVTISRWIVRAAFVSDTASAVLGKFVILLLKIKC